MPQEATAGLDPIAFWIPNTKKATRANLKNFVVSINQLQDLLKTHGQLNDEVNVQETFDIPDDVKATYDSTLLKRWMKNVNNCRKAAPDVRWKREYCRSKKIAMPDCQLAVDDEESWCFELSQMTGVAATWQKKHDTRCKSFEKDRDKILTDLAKPAPTRKIGEAAKVCETAVGRVCRESLCPTYKAIKKDNDLNCDEACGTSENKMFQTGSIPCDTEGKNGDKETFGDCLDDLHKSLRAAGRYPELEVLMREHTVKCICVSAKENTEICYEGSYGIPKLKKWCEFDGTGTSSSWQKLLDTDRTVVPPTPTCNQNELVPQ